MIPDEFPSVSLHNVAELADPDWTDGGRTLRRTPDSVTAGLNDYSRERMGHPSGCELRFVPDRDSETVAVTLSAASATTVYPFWGPFQLNETYDLDSTPRTIELPVPDRVPQLRSDVVATSPFDPSVCRLRFHYVTPVAIHDVSGSCRPPSDAELPDRRYVAYGTSITEGMAASGPHLTYVSQVARQLGADVRNLGSGGSAYCDPAMADYIASLERPDVITLALSVNMANADFTVAEFRRRATEFVDVVARAHPESPVACVTLYPFHADAVRGDAEQRARDFRAALSAVVDASERDNVSLIEGPAVMDVPGLTPDILHPGDLGMASIGRGIATAIDVSVERRG